MNTRGKKLALLALLMTAAGAAWWQYGGVAPSGRGNAVTPAPMIPTGDRIHKLGSFEDAPGGTRPLFSFDRPPAQPARPPEIVIKRFPDPPPIIDPIGPPVDKPPVKPAPEPPNVSLQYTGYARAEDNRMVAFLEANGSGVPAGHYNLREEDYLLGRFRVNSISADAVEIEDTQRDETSPSRRQRITINPTLAVRR
ncbi:MAG TPA: hypothetical protein VFY29_01170 [Terriglobia bacterium]|nr:hypothetical protein [Terriglobia bacterium]